MKYRPNFDKMVRKIIQVSFTLICWVVFSLMVFYWFYKFKIEDRDIGVLDLISLEEAIDVEFPMPTICLIYPFINGKFKDFNSEINATVYLDYLKGNVVGDSLQTIDYENVTINLDDYFLYATEKWINDTDTLINSSLVIRHETIFSGFNANDRFLKCFAIETDLTHHRHIKEIGFHYDKAKLLGDWEKDPDVDGNWIDSSIHYYGIKFHQKGQFLIGEEPDFWSFLNVNEYDYIQNWIYELEVIKRRNTYNKRCLENKTTYDSSMIEKYIIKKGCRAPYLKAADIKPMCNTSKDIKTAKLTYGKTKTIDHLKPCNRISKLNFETESDNTYRDWSVHINFPEEVKTIIQSKEVDIHSLIGNVGGYLGLFMGYAIVQIPAMIFLLYDLFVAKL